MKNFDKIFGWEFTIWIIYKDISQLNKLTDEHSPRTERDRIWQFIWQKMWLLYPKYKIYFLWAKANIDISLYDFCIEVDSEKLKN